MQDMFKILHQFFLLVINFLFPKSPEEIAVEKINLEKLLNIRRIREKEKNICSLFIYKDSKVKKIIELIKYKKNQTLIDKCGKLLSERIDKNKSEFVLIPIPQSKQRKRERGFNQTELICEAIIKNSENNFGYQPNILKRIKKAESQTKLNRKERLKNISGSMLILEKDEDYLKNKNIILIDDVWTTGATLEEAVRVLKKVKVKSIFIYTLAH